MAVGRFQVMSILQACRAEALGLQHDSALSWGLNRAIFFAAAKRGFRGGASSSSSVRGAPSLKQYGDTYRLGDEMAFVDKRNDSLYFTIGGQTQTPEDFRRQIVSRFGEEAYFEKAWAEARQIIEKFDSETLESGRKFYEEVYKPRRDALVAKWSKFQVTPQRSTRKN